MLLIIPVQVCSQAAAVSPGHIKSTEANAPSNGTYPISRQCMLHTLLHVSDRHVKLASCESTPNLTLSVRSFLRSCQTRIEHQTRLHRHAGQLFRKPLLLRCNAMHSQQIPSIVTLAAGKGDTDVLFGHYTNRIADSLPLLQTTLDN